MNEYLEILNEEQKEAVLTTSRYVRIVAGAGSGKTRVLTSRVYHLIEDLGIDPKSIVAITFTNKAANVMKERLNRLLGVRASAVHISTIHSLCVTILRQEIQVMGYPRNFTVLDQDDQKSILKEAYKEHDIDRQRISFSSTLDYIANNKYAHITPERALEMAGDFVGERNKALAYKYYEDRRVKLYALDFDDLLLYTTKMFDDFPLVLSKWQGKFTHIHVDEFQDIDKVQYKLIKQLAGAYNEVYVVGDPDQTIYTWRGADINIIMNFDKDFKPTETLMLKRNYRSDAPILEGANSLIKNNANRLEKDLYTKRTGGDKIIHYKGMTDEYEARWVANKILEKSKDQPLTDFAVLYRSNYLSRLIEKSLVDCHLQYVIYGGTRFYDRAEIKDALSYLRMIDTADDLSFKRVINTPRRKIGQKTIDNIFDYAQVHNMSMYEAAKNEKIASGQTQQSINDFVSMIEDFKSKKETMPLYNLLELVLDKSGYRAMLEEDKETERLENLKELINDVREYEETYPESGLDEYLQMINLYGDRTDFTGGNVVQLMTVHAAKGLEFDTVFVIGMSDGIFPSEKAMAEGKKGLEEERRLAYVAYTRAMHKLYLTESGGYSYQSGRPKQVSRFIDEIDERYIEHIGANFDYSRPVDITLDEYEEKLNQRSVIKDTIKSKLPKASGIRKGDLVEHTLYGTGVILNIEDGKMEIAFGHPYGVKKIVEGHPSVVKK